MNHELVIQETPDAIKISKAGTSIHIQLGKGEPTVKRRKVEFPDDTENLQIDDRFLYFSHGSLFVSMELDEGDAYKILEVITSG